ncbi:uncharacterized protein UTRI_10084 [Ustilago trichophora]|uniref:Uncharacterized protein n=1 Tax=Ustilago trichophora TaxID=86804 RepID=A0A5C3E633_9BASI|nr:uncharacterized protein UTRI_10084 [Ustilago trichophora]
MGVIFAAFCCFTIIGLFEKLVKYSRSSLSEASTRPAAIPATEKERERREGDADKIHLKNPYPTYRSEAAEAENSPSGSSKAVNLEDVQGRHEASTSCSKPSGNDSKPSKGKQTDHADHADNNEKTFHPDPQPSTSPNTDLAQVFEALFDASKCVLGWGCDHCQHRGNFIMLRWAMEAVEWWANYTGYGGIWLRELNKMVGMRTNDDEVAAADGSDKAGECPGQSLSGTAVVPKMRLGEWVLKLFRGCMQGAKSAWDCKRCQRRANTLLYRLGWKAVTWIMVGKESRRGWLDVVHKLVLWGLQSSRR